MSAIHFERDRSPLLHALDQNNILFHAGLSCTIIAVQIDSNDQFLAIIQQVVQQASKFLVREFGSFLRVQYWQLFVIHETLKVAKCINLVLTFVSSLHAPLTDG